jgi:hypothetical protein
VRLSYRRSQRGGQRGTGEASKEQAPGRAEGVVEAGGRTDQAAKTSSFFETWGRVVYDGGRIWLARSGRRWWSGDGYASR